MSRTVFVTTDGVSHGESGGADITVIARNEDDRVLKRLEYTCQPDVLSDEQAQYAALIEGIALAKSLSPGYVVFITESEEMRARLTCRAPVPRDCRTLHSVCLRAIDWALGVRWSVWCMTPKK